MANCICGRDHSQEPKAEATRSANLDPLKWVPLKWVPPTSPSPLLESFDRILRSFGLPPPLVWLHPLLSGPKEPDQPPPLPRRMRFVHFRANHKVVATLAHIEVKGEPGMFKVGVAVSPDRLAPGDDNEGFSPGSKTGGRHWALHKLKNSPVLWSRDQLYDFVRAARLKERDGLYKALKKHALNASTFFDARPAPTETFSAAVDWGSQDPSDITVTAPVAKLNPGWKMADPYDVTRGRCRGCRAHRPSYSNGTFLHCVDCARNAGAFA